MPNNSSKRNVSIPPTSSVSDKDVYKLLFDVQQKINGSPALNGGFDALLYKVDKIEECQGKIVDKVDQIHDSIYDPDKGIFNRISNLKNDQAKDLSALDRKITELSVWKDQTEKENTSAKTSGTEIQKKLDDQQKKIENIDSWKNTANSIFKAIVMGLGGGVMTIVGKLLYDYVVVHWK